MDDLDHLPKEIIQKITFYLSLREIFAFSITNHRYFELIKNIDVKDPYLGYILISISRIQPILSNLELIKISEKNNNKSLLINYGKKVFIYQFSSGKWIIEKLTRKLAKYALSRIDFPYPSINGYKLIYRVDENEYNIISNTFLVLKKSTLLLSLKKDGKLHVTGYHPNAPIDTILLPDEAHCFYQQLPNIDKTSKNMRFIYNIIKKCDKDLSKIEYTCRNLNTFRRKFSGILHDKFENENLSCILKKCAAPIKFNNILQKNTKRKLRLEKINVLNFKHNNSILNLCISPNVMSIRTLIFFMDPCDLISFVIILSLFITLFGLTLVNADVIPPAITTSAYAGCLFYAGEKLRERFNENAEIMKLNNQNQNSPNPFL